MKATGFTRPFLLGATALFLLAGTGFAQEPLNVLAINDRSDNQSAAPESTAPLVPTVEDGALCTTIDFEGLGDQVAVPEFDGIASPGWLSIIDADAGGTGNFAFEPSPETIAFWLGGSPGARDILIDDAASSLSFFYASFVSVRLDAFDADGNLVDSAVGPPNFNQGPGGDPNGSFNKWDPLAVESDENNIVRVQVTGNVNQTGIDDLKVCRQLRIHSLEITQAIQEIQEIEDLAADLAGDREPPVPIIEGKLAVMRVYLQQVQAVTRVDVEVDIPGVLNQTRPLTMQPQCDPDLRRRRENGCLSLDYYFEPPGGDWEATVRLLTDTGEELESHELPLRSRDADSLVLRSVSVCDARDAATGDWQCGNGALVGGLIGFLGRTTPSHEVRVSATNNFVRNDIAGYDADGDGTVDNDEAVQWFFDTAAQIGNLYGLWDRLLGVFGQQRYYYGMMRNAVPTTIGGIADDIPSRGAMSRESTVRLGVEVNDETLAHETGHMLGRRHTNTNVPVAAGSPPGCYHLAADGGTDWPFADNTLQSNNGPEVGFNVAARRVVLPESNFDWMGYCIRRWISPFTYVEAMTPLGATAASQAVVDQFWTVGGTLEAGGVSFDPIFELEVLGPDDTGSGDYLIEVRDGSGVVLAFRSFATRTAVAESTSGDFTGPPVFFELVAAQAGAAEIVVLDPARNQIGSVPISGVAPTVSITAPGSGDQLGGVEELTWTITDPDSTEHWSAVDYSVDGGASWARLGLVPGENSLVVNFDGVSGSTSPLLRVTATDGVNSGFDVADDFGVEFKTPTVEILAPAVGDVFVAGDLVFLEASAYDPDDGFLEGAAVSWSSNLDGSLGTGARLSAAGLSGGEHVIDIEATDSDGNLATASTTVRVAEGAPDLDLDVVKLDELPTTCVQVTIDALSTSSAVGLASVEYSLDGGSSWTPVALSGLPARFIVPGEGFFHLVARAFDEAGQADADDDRFFIDSPCASRPPVADAGPDQTLECTSPEGTTVILDGSGSFDPDGSPLTYEWRDADGNVVGTTPTVDVVLQLGTFTFTLIVDDGTDGVDSDEVEVTVQDTEAPVIDGLTATPNVLWPPNHKMVPVSIVADVIDVCDDAVVAQIIGVTSSEPVTGPGDKTSPDWEITGPLSVNLRAERTGGGDGRIYTVEVEATDASGNASTATVEVTVPHDQSK